MKDFTPQQMHFLEAVGDSYLSVVAGESRWRFIVGNKEITGRGLLQTFEGLLKRDALVACRERSGSQWVASLQAKTQLAEQRSRPLCPHCGQHVRTRCAATGDMSRRFFAVHSGWIIGRCPGSRAEVGN